MKKMEDYPLTLGTKDVAEILGVSKPTAYKIMKRENFPLIDTGWKMIVQRDAFFEWMKKAN